MNNFGKNFNDLHDILAIRIIVDSIDSCYLVLGYLHQKYVPIYNRFKDYIAIPKNNLYQSLHTTVATPNGTIIEIQIRTIEMNIVAEKGVAAHWQYKENNNVETSKTQTLVNKTIDMFQQILELDRLTADDKDSNALIESINNDILSDLVYVLTPKRKLITLPSRVNSFRFCI